MQLPLEPGHSTPTTTPRLMMLDLINAALPTWQDAVPDLGHWDSIRDWDADSAGNGESHGRMAIGNCARLLGKQRRQDEPHCHFLMMIIYCPEGLMGPPIHFALPLVFRTPHPGLLGGNDFRFGLPRAWANICHGFLFPQPGQTNCLQYLLFVRCSAAVDNDEMAAWATDPPPGQEISACDLTKGTRDPES